VWQSLRMSTLKIALPDDLDLALEERVKASGARSKEEYLLALVESDCAASDLDWRRRGMARPSFRGWSEKPCCPARATVPWPAPFPAFFPAIHKIGLGGYDGRGIVSLKNIAEYNKGFDEPAVLEKKIDIAKEISIIVASNHKNETVIYPAVHMMINPVLNLLEYQVSPAELDEKILWKAEAIALKVVKNLNSPGIFAVEMFIDRYNNLWVNETAPRVHNSGHHTIEANYCSQFDMLLRIMLDYPLGNTKHILPAAIVNILGEENYIGNAVYEGLDEVLKMDDVFVHIYGKKHTKPGRKMGHVTILSNEKQELIHTATKIKQLLKVRTS